MKNVFLFFVSFFLISNAFACINEYRTLLSGKIIENIPTSGKVSPKEIDANELRKKAKVLLADYERTDSVVYYSDYAAALTYLGEYEKAKQVYEEIELKSPGLYTTASNLGTIYELMGDPEKALFWIKKSVEINPDSHDGSEWIHIKILEHKLSGKPISDSLLDLHFGDADKPANPNQYDLEQLADHIWHQLRERTTFVKPKNEIVGSIYFDLGNIIAQTVDVEAALESYAAAKEYGFTSELMDKRIAKLSQLTKRTEIVDKGEEYVKKNFFPLFTIGLVFFGFLLIWFFKKKKKS